jgi:hypothetical protein
MAYWNQYYWRAPGLGLSWFHQANKVNMAILLVFVVLQFCDLATTLVFLRHGVAEGNPLIAALIRLSAHPAMALLVVKLAACGLAVYAWRSRRTRLLRRANFFFALCVGWNLFAIASA